MFLSFNFILKVNKTEIIKVEAENKLKTLRKEMASTMVPIVQKVYNIVV
jgi:hypothetical protein